MLYIQLYALKKLKHLYANLGLQLGQKRNMQREKAKQFVLR